MCNQTDYTDTCPYYWFTSLVEYATCACHQIYWFDDENGRNGTYEYFTELTSMIENMFAAFRDNKEDCPEWQFSCNEEGDATLDVWEIQCPIESDNSTNLTALRNDIFNGVKAKVSWQIELDEETLVVNMYDAESAAYASYWLSLNTTEDKIDYL